MALEAAATGLGAAGGGLEAAFGVVALLETALEVLADMSAPEPRTGFRPESTLAARAKPAPPTTVATEPAGKTFPAEDAAATGGAVLGALIAFFLAACTFSFSTAKAPPVLLLLLTAL